MEVYITAFLISLVTAIGTGFVTFLIQERQMAKQLEIEKLKIDADFKSKIEEIKTEYIAERTAKAYLNHPDYKKRSFSLLKGRLGGFSDDELRKILVRAGAVKFMGPNSKGQKIEWWGLLDRNPEISIKDKEEEL